MVISRSKVYELALSSIKAGHVDDFMKQYIPSAVPIVTEYGGRFLINGAIQNSAVGRFPAKTFALLEWPSIDRFVEINKDKRMLPLLERRNHYLDFIVEGCFYKVSEDTEFEIPDSKRMRLLLSDRAVREEGDVRFQWIEDVRNQALSLNLYFSGDRTTQYDKERDIEAFSLQIR